MPTGIGTTARVSKETSEQQTYIQSALGLSTSNSPKKSNRIRDSLRADIESKSSQAVQVNDILLLLDIDLDQYDELIVNIDEKIPSPITEINTKITAVQDAYRDRVSIGCKSDLEWVFQSSKTVTGFGSDGSPFTQTYSTYKVEKIASEYRTINYYGAKYFKRPKDRDYGSSAVKELPSASVGIGSTYMIINDSTEDANGFTILSGIQTNDTITDSIEQPTIFVIGELPEVVGFGSTSLLGISTTFGGSISFGSTILAYAGINTTSGITTGDTIWRTGVTAIDSVVVGFGTTSVEVVGVNTLGVTTTFELDTTSIILSQPAIASTSQSIFNVGIFTSYPTIFISTTSEVGTEDDNFFVIRQTGSDENFDPATSGENPVEVGLIKNSSKTGYGHKLNLINNGNPDVTKTYIEQVDPEPSVGAGFASYYEGTEQWPGVRTPILGGPGGTTVIGYTFTYASEGQTQTVIAGLGTITSSGIGYSGTSAADPSVATCNAADAAISTAESELDSIKTKNLPIINDYISKTSTLRRIRDTKQSQAWNYRRGRGSLNNEVKQLKADLKVLQGIDFDDFE